MQFKTLLRPQTLAEACRDAALPNTVILGGGLWVRMQKRCFDNAVDLSALGLDKIEETDTALRIGAYVTLRELETSPLLLSYTKGAVKTAFSPIVGVQFRNGATLGGSIFGRFGFSDVTALFSALGARVVLANGGEVSMADFLKNGAPHDILTHLLLPKDAPDACVALSHRESATDFPVVTVAAVKRGDTLTLTASPAPVRACSMTLPVSEKHPVDRFMEPLSLPAETSDALIYRDRLTRVLLGRAVGGVL